MSLTVRQHAALDIADQLSRSNRTRVPVLEATGYTEPRLWQVVNTLLDDPDAIAERPALVARLRRLRDRRRAARTSSAQG